MNYQDLGFNAFLTRRITFNSDTTDSNTNISTSSASLDSSSSVYGLSATTDISFSSTDYNTAAWTAGNLFFANGAASGTIDAGNTGDITAKTYVYYDSDKPTTLQTTADIKSAQGATRVMLAIIEVGESGKACKITPIIASGLSMNITAEQITVNQLDALSTNTGTLTVDESVSVGNKIILDGINSEINVKDSGGNDAVDINSSGISIYNGKLEIKDNNDTTIIDSYGLVSQNNFNSSNVNGYPFTDFTNTSFQIVTNTDSITLEINRFVTVLIILSLVGSSSQISSGSNCSGRTWYQVHSNLNGVLANFYYDSFLDATTNVRENIISKDYSISNICELFIPGTHTISIRSKIEYGNNFKSTLNYYNMSIIELGN
jgi:hypothetical protein